MGDNRDNSNDSRYWDDPAIAPELRAMVPEENILGKAVFLPLKLSRVR
ncbi:signal peptidase I [Pseudomonas sp. URIL14HWK12:I9]|nr:signal peptidase I [Pseudomonas sp. URIL14HWK12:I12]PVZ24796.1 signal peptidase I [Pseudomonas sp. URIL14HWK12:I10]PVZ34642.1 signal peptidase I [Pseudomonas sp. URIL14HWK12:I11]SNZ08843.1 signal peptidase I [Pseudomonas sp. URIL14HWK12:I9]